MILSLGVFALASFATPGSSSAPVYSFSLGASASDASASSGGMAKAMADRRSASAAAAEAAQTLRNSRAALETAEAVSNEANAEAERLQKLAVQARADFELAKAERKEVGETATTGVQDILDDALDQDAKLTSFTATYEQARRAYVNSTDEIVVLKKHLAEAEASEKSAAEAAEKATAVAAAAKETADSLSKAAEELNAKAQADPRTGEIDAEEAKKKTMEVSAAAGKAKAAEIVAARAEKKAADAQGAHDAEKLLLKTATEALEDEEARNERLAAASAQGEQNMIQQAHATSLARVAAADARSVAESAFYNASSTDSQMEETANKADEKAAIAATVAATRDAEAKAAAVAYRAAADADAIARSQLALAESEVKVEEKKKVAAANLVAETPESDQTTIVTEKAKRR